MAIPKSISGIASSLASVFRLRGRVGPGVYLTTGVSLALLKYGVEAGTIYAATGQYYSTLDFLNPLLSSRERFTAGAPAALGVGLILWSLPFLWISVAMSLRRCRDAGQSAWYALLMLVPGINFALMLYLSLTPSTEAAAQPSASIDEPPISATTSMRRDDERQHIPEVIAGLIGITAGVLYALILVFVSVHVFSTYGSMLFFGTPFIVGVVSAAELNRRSVRSFGETVWHTIFIVILASCGLLLFAMEGVICIAMALPIMIPVACMGAAIGRALVYDRARDGFEPGKIVGCLLIVPLLALVESKVARSPEFSVESSVEIDAPPETVWRNVVAFPAISAEPDWFFRLGIAAPMQARIDGRGVGATRHCEFTTGAFVEPITEWAAPRRLAFDVTEQPEPMFELTPYRSIHPPHLDGSFQATRGEFRLEPLDGGRTRLIGTTWYTVSIYPHAYWTLWTDALIHRIHLRVLNHIAETTEREAQRPANPR